MEQTKNQENSNKWKTVGKVFGFLFIGIMFASLIVYNVPTHEEKDVLTRSSEVITNGGGKCEKDKDCGTGTCVFASNVTIGKCDCDANNQFTGANCDYERKSQLIAFLLSFFVGTYGADRFYLGYIGVGVVKLLLGLGICASPCFLCCGDCGKVVSGIWAAVVGLAIFIWWIVDWALIIQGKIPDFNGVSLLQNL